MKNETFGINEGHTGKLHAFTCYWHGAGMAPVPPEVNSTFDAYAEMFHFIKFALESEDKKGMTYLESAMGLN